jgi:hypothetical protein
MTFTLFWHILVQLAVPLQSNVNWNEVGCITLYCEEFYADLGHLKISRTDINDSEAVPAPSPLPKSPPFAATLSPSTPALPSRSPDFSPSSDAKPGLSPSSILATDDDPLFSLANCIELIPGYLNLRWTVSQGVLTLGMEGLPGVGNRWLSFGFSPSNATGVQMIGSDVVIGECLQSETYCTRCFIFLKLQPCRCAFSQATLVLSKVWLMFSAC